MKRNFFSLAILCVAGLVTACNNDADTNAATATNTDDTSGSAISQDAGVNNNISSTTAVSGENNAANQMPLNAADSTFVMKAAAGNRMEIEAGNAARQNAQSERVKAYGVMMVQDHQTANQELMTATGRGLSLPDTLPRDKRQMVDRMSNMKGKAFDKHYMSMMVEDHRKNIADFQKQANSGTNAGLKAYAQRTLPVLQKHLDSAVAINGAIK